MKNYRHDIGKTIDYGWDFTDWLTDGDTIQTVTVTTTPAVGPATAGAGVVNAGTAVACKLTTSVDTWLTFHITTTNGLTDDRTLRTVAVQR